MTAAAADASPRHYPQRPWVGVGVVLIRGDEVLLVCRGSAPRAGAWSLPGGAQAVGETAEAAAHRELAEETAATAHSLALLGHADAIHHDAAGRVLYHYTILDFWGFWRAGEPKAGGDAAQACFAPRRALAAYALDGATRAMIDLGFSAAAAAAPG